MLAYQLRRRILQGVGVTDFPGTVSIEIDLEPHPGFGDFVSGAAVLTPQGKAKAQYDGENGRIELISQENPLAPLAVSINQDGTMAGLVDGTFVIRGVRESREDLLRWLNGSTYVLPTILTPLFGEPVVVRRVRGSFDGQPFKWTYHRGAPMLFESVTQGSQEEKVLRGWNLLQVITQPENVRLAAALQYFHVACRLARVGSTAWEFAPEVVMNLTKVLESLFPPSSRDAVRAGLRSTGFADDVIERDYLPIMALRSGVDAAHISLKFLSAERLEVLHEYTQSAEDTVRTLLKKILDALESGGYTVPAYDPAVEDKHEDERIIDRLRDHLEARKAAKAQAQP